MDSRQTDMYHSTLISPNMSNSSLVIPLHAQHTEASQTEHLQVELARSVTRSYNRHTVILDSHTHAHTEMLTWEKYSHSTLFPLFCHFSTHCINIESILVLTSTRTSMPTPSKFDRSLPKQRALVFSLVVHSILTTVIINITGWWEEWICWRGL